MGGRHQCWHIGFFQAQISEIWLSKTCLAMKIKSGVDQLFGFSAFSIL